MLGAIVGDIIGSVYEFKPWHGAKKDILLFSPDSTFTDDTVMTMAVADTLMQGWRDVSDLKDRLIDNFHLFGKKYRTVGFSRKFYSWIMEEQRESYNTCGNGSAMRVSPVAYAFDTIENVEKYATISAELTHNHPEAIKGACAVAGSIYLASIGNNKDEIKTYVETNYGYDLSRPLNDIRKTYSFNGTCQGSVPEAIIAFLESDSFETAIRNAIWLHGDADTQAAIAGSIAEAFYGGVPDEFAYPALDRLDEYLYKLFLDWDAWVDKEGKK